MKKLIFILILFCSIHVFAQNYSGTNIRGKVLTYNAYFNTMVPFQSVLVSMYFFNIQANRWILVNETITNNEGFYFFFNVIPGMYTIQVNRNKNYQINVIWIDYRFYQFQDIPILNY